MSNPKLQTLNPKPCTLNPEQVVASAVDAVWRVMSIGGLNPNPES